jgi:hypothetical protein
MGCLTSQLGVAKCKLFAWMPDDPTLAKTRFAKMTEFLSRAG